MPSSSGMLRCSTASRLIWNVSAMWVVDYRGLTVKEVQGGSVVAFAGRRFHEGVQEHAHAHCSSSSSFHARRYVEVVERVRFRGRRCRRFRKAVKNFAKDNANEMLDGGCGGFRRRRSRSLRCLPRGAHRSDRRRPSPASLVVSLLPSRCAAWRQLRSSKKAVADQKDRCVIATVDAA